MFCNRTYSTILLSELFGNLFRRYPAYVFLQETELPVLVRTKTEFWYEDFIANYVIYKYEPQAV